MIDESLTPFVTCGTRVCALSVLLPVPKMPATHDNLVGVSENYTSLSEVTRLFAPTARLPRVHPGHLRERIDDDLSMH